MNSEYGKKILIIEDEIDLAELLAINIRIEGNDAIIALNGEEGLRKITSDRPDLVILDVMMPGISGLEVCKLLRKNGDCPGIPVIMVTSRGEESDRIMGLEAGADDYVVKPYSIRELMLRIKAKLRGEAAVTPEKNLFGIGPLSIDIEKHHVAYDGKEILLTTTEFKLLATLARSQGRLFSRDELLNDVWKNSCEIDSRTVDTHITRLRSKLGEAGEMLKTIRGFGYKLDSI